MKAALSRKENNIIRRASTKKGTAQHFVPSRTFEVAMNDPFTLQKIARAKEILGKYPPPEKLFS